MNFYPFNDIETISPHPMLFISGDQAHSKEFSEEVYRLAAEPKELVCVQGAGHVDLYDRVDLIPFEKLTSFFNQHLSTWVARWSLRLLKSLLSASVIAFGMIGPTMAQERIRISLD
ncbi:alpha/beta hydrolase [Phyllobacteriaceae bacterium JZ32]